MERPPTPVALDRSAARDRSPSVVLVVLNWNRWSATQACVESLAAILSADKHIVVVDNGSRQPPTREDVLEIGGDEFIQTGANLGYAGGNNAGLRHALDIGAEFAWILNNDTVADPAAFAELVALASRDSSIGVLTTNVASPDGKLESDVAFKGSPEDAPWDYFGRFHPVECGGCALGFHASDAVRGPSLFLRLSALPDVGFFDESYFHYYEELDLVERIRRAGWTSGLACRAVVSHASGTTLAAETGQSIYYLFRNYLLFRRKLYGESVLGVLARHPLLLPRYVAAPRHTLRGELTPMRAYGLALVDAMRARDGRRQLGAAFETPLPFKE
jgi:GT2 family glycosyltransferase